MTKNIEIEITVPSWIESHRALAHGQATPLQRFVALNEPASGELREHFRAHLAAALADVAARPARCSGSPRISRPSRRRAVHRAT